VPDLVAVELEQRVAALVEQHRSELEHPVDAELDRQLDALVAERIQARNGNGHASLDRGDIAPSPSRQTGGDVPATKTCTRCGLEKPIDQYEKFRNICWPCRRLQEREREERRAAECGELPVPIPARNGLALDELADRVAPKSKPLPAAELHEWLVEHGFAIDRGGMLEATPFGVEVGTDLSFPGLFDGATCAGRYSSCCGATSLSFPRRNGRVAPRVCV
jgi:hypothetical protein